MAIRQPGLRLGNLGFCSKDYYVGMEEHSIRIIDDYVLHSTNIFLLKTNHLDSNQSIM